VPPGGTVQFGFGAGTAIPHSLLFVNGLLPAAAAFTTQVKFRDDPPGTAISDLTADFVRNDGSATFHTDITITGGPNVGPLPRGLTCFRDGVAAPDALRETSFLGWHEDVVVVDMLTTSVDFGWAASAAKRPRKEIRRQSYGP
jgi:hypothetical protein